MGNTNYPIGSKPNPVSWASYNQDVNNNNWAHPAWVESDEGNKFLADSNGEAVSCTGSYGSPYTGSMFQQLYSAGCWSGGWVNDEDEIIYISSNNTRYPAIEDEIFGSEDNPIPEDIYEEMCDNEIWSGGWVIDSNNNVDFVDGNESPNAGNTGSGEEEGSGCDEGCGSNGDGADGGDNMYVRYVDEGSYSTRIVGKVTFIVSIHWSEGSVRADGNVYGSDFSGSDTGSESDPVENQPTGRNPSRVDVNLSQYWYPDNRYSYVTSSFNAEGEWISFTQIRVTVRYKYRDYSDGGHIKDGAVSEDVTVFSDDPND